MSLYFTDASSNQWTINNYGHLYVSKSSQNLYDTGNMLSVSVVGSSSSVYLSYGSATSTTNTHSVTGTNTTSKLSVTRDAYAGNGFTRFVESFTNTDTVAKTITITLGDNIYYDGNTTLTQTSSGDQLLTTADDWFSVGNSYTTTKPNALHVISGTGALNPTTSTFSYDTTNTTFTITLAAGETKSLMHFYAPTSDTTTATTLGNSIASLASTDYLVGLSSTHIGQIQNFTFDISSSSSTTLSAGYRNLTLTGTSAINGTGNANDNTITGNSAINTLNGMDGNDILIGNAGNDTLNGGAGNDTLDGGTGNDAMVGGTGNDIYVVDSTSDVITESSNEGTDTVQSSITYSIANQPYLENIELTGSAAINATGNSANNILKGNSGNNTLTGGAGNDIYYIQNTGDVVVEATSAGTDKVIATISYTLGSNVENLTLSGTSSINATGNSSHNTLTGNSGKNTLSGLAGNDVLDGGTGADIMLGGAGDDIYYVDNTSDKVYETTTTSSSTDAGGNDTVNASISFTLGTYVENLTLTGTNSINATGNSANNILIGNNANNILNGKAGSDTMSGGAGNDTYIVDSTTDYIIEASSEGTDTVQTALTTYTLGSNIENGLMLAGSSTMNGNSSNNTITGNSAANSINGDLGNDVLRGGGGNDTLNGGDGDDVLIGDNGYADGQIVSDSAVIDGETVSLNISLPESASGSLTVTGTIANVDFSQAANIVYIIDQSGSMSSTFYGNTSVGDLNGDGYTNSTLDAAIASFKKLNESIISSGFGSSINVALVPFSDSASILYSGLANTDSNGNNISDVVEKMLTLTTLGGTNYTAALTSAQSYLAGLGSSGQNIVFFASDGAPNDTNYLTSILPSLRATGSEGTIIKAIGMGTGATEEILDILDDSISNNSATIVTNPEELDASLISESVVGLAEGAWIEIYKDGTLVDLIGSDQFTISPLGVQFKSKSITLGTTGNATISAKLIMSDANATTLSASAPVSIKSFVSNDTLNGGAGNDTLDGGYGTDTMTGGLGNDTYYVDNSGDVIIENANEGTDTVYAEVSYTLANNFENLILQGTSNINAYGNSTNNTLTGNSANNILDGKAGNDTMIGGVGNDIYYVDSSYDVVTEKLSEGTDTIVSTINLTLGGDYTYTSSYYYYNVENATLSSNATGTTLTGSSSNNVLTGNSAANTLYGNAGNDTLNGSTGADTMLGGIGDDIYYVDNVGDLVYETTTTTSGINAGGNDTVKSSISYTLGSYVENLTLTGTSAINATGNSANNTLIGNSANNILKGGTGYDTMKGSAGNDTYYVDSVFDKIVELTNEGTDTVYSSIGYKISEGLENLTLQGTGNTAGSGNSSNNILTGNTGNNYLFGYAGNDTLRGGLGNDTLSGGTGSDNFVFNTALNASTNKDTLTDFSHTSDTIQLDDAIFAKLTSATYNATTKVLNASSFSSTGVAVDTNDYIIYNKTTGALYYDADGSGSGVAVQFALLGTKPQDVDATDFVIY